jgi:threonylcarbamoyladenosine tRNA methylthiotransferase MtaB
MPSIAFHTLGCKLNFSETSTLARQFKDAGWDKVEFSSPADVYLINTCSVTENADKECRTIVHRAMQSNPEAKVIVTGCYAQLKPESILEIPGVNLVLGAAQKFDVLRYLNDLEDANSKLAQACEIDTVTDFIPAQSFEDRTRVFMKVQDGCDYSCTFCTIPLARGRSRSDTIPNVIRRAIEIKEKGAREIILTGVNLGDFGIRDEGGRHQDRFQDLVNALDETSALEGMRFRISSIEPNLLSESIIRTVAASKRFMPHFHIPLQSGSDEMLKKMKRRYLSPLYRERIEMIHSMMPNAGIGADVITGFPGETEEEFLKTVDFLKDLQLTYLHAFTYSERENTPAINYDGVVPINIRKDRTRMLRSLSDKFHRRFCAEQEGSEEVVLFEQENKDGRMLGYTRNYIRVSAPWDAHCINTPLKITIGKLQPEGWVDVVIKEPAFA